MFCLEELALGFNAMKIILVSQEKPAGAMGG